MRKHLLLPPWKLRVIWLSRLRENVWVAQGRVVRLEALQGWLLKLRDHSKKLRISIELLSDWLTNQNPQRSVYQVFMSGCLIALDNLTGVRLVSFGETWHQRFEKCILKVTGSEATHACKNDHI